jgi:aspartate/methionine/tyrosine aminotransferase
MKLSVLTNNLTGQPMFALKQKIRQLELSGRRIIHLEIGDTDWDTPEVIRQAAIDSLKKGETHYTASGGMVELKEAIIKDTCKEYGFTPSLDEIVVMPANAIIDFVIRCVCDKGDTVRVPNPCFPTYLSALKYLGIRINDSLLKLIIINSPSNPTGMMVAYDMVEDLVQISIKRSDERDLYILLDEVYSKLVFDGILKPDYSNVDRSTLIFLKSFSKTYSMAGFRLGYVICNRRLAEKISLLFQTIFSCMPVFVQRAGIAALEHEDEILPERLKYLKECRDLMVDGLRDIGIKCDRPNGAFYVFPDVSKTRLTEELLLENGLAVLNGEYFGSNGKGHLRMCFAKEKKELETALKIIKKLL